VAKNSGSTEVTDGAEVVETAQKSIVEIIHQLTELTSTSNLYDLAQGVITNFGADLSSVSFVAVAPLGEDGSPGEYVLAYGENLDGKEPILEGFPTKVDSKVHESLRRVYLWIALAVASRTRDDRGTAYIGWVARHGQTCLDLIGDRSVVIHYPKATCSTQVFLLSEAVSIARMQSGILEASKAKFGVSKVIQTRTKAGEPEDLSEFVLI